MICIEIVVRGGIWNLEFIWGIGNFDEYGVQSSL